MSLSATFQMHAGDGTEIECETIVAKGTSLPPYPVLTLRQYGIDTYTGTLRNASIQIIADRESLANLRDELLRYFATEEAGHDPNVIDYRPVPAEACT